MNERIRELVKQAGGHFSTHTLTSYPAQHRESIQLWDQNIEKFAESIVRECIKELENDTRCRIAGADKIVAKHFGVE